MLRAHRQRQRERMCSCSGGLDPCWSHPPAPLQGQGAAGGTALPLGISEQGQVLATVGMAQSYRAHQASEHLTPCLPETRRAQQQDAPSSGASAMLLSRGWQQHLGPAALAHTLHIRLTLRSLLNTTRT